MIINKNNNHTVGLLNTYTDKSSCILYPIDYIKILLQLNKSSKFSTYLVKSIKNNKFQIYTGLKPALIHQFIYINSKINVYNILKNNKYLHNKNNFILGGLTGGISQIIASPFDLIKIRYISEKKNNNNISIINTVNNIVNKNGVLSLWKGALPSIYRSIFINASEFVTYNYFKNIIQNNTEINNNLFIQFYSSLSASFISAIICSPIDVVKSKIMNSNSSHNNICNYLLQIIKNEGIMRLYKNFIYTWLRLAPTQIIFWITYEKCNNLKNV